MITEDRDIYRYQRDSGKKCEKSECSGKHCLMIRNIIILRALKILYKNKRGGMATLPSKRAADATSGRAVVPTLLKSPGMLGSIISHT